MTLSSFIASGKTVAEGDICTTDLILIFNNGTIDNNGTIVNNGRINNESGGFNNNSGSTLINNGQFDGLNGINDNGGTITGSGVFNIPELNITLGIFRPEGARAEGSFNLSGGTLQLFNPTDTPPLDRQRRCQPQQWQHRV